MLISGTFSFYSTYKGLKPALILAIFFIKGRFYSTYKGLKPGEPYLMAETHQVFTLPIRD